MMTEQYIQTENGSSPVEFMSPTGETHSVIDFGGDGVVLSGTPNTNWSEKSFPWDKLNLNGFIPLCSKQPVTLSEIKNTIIGTR